MSYNIRIGNACIEPQTDEELHEVEVTVERKDLPEAPSAPGEFEPNAGSNERWPGYSAWSGFADEAGLHKMFFDEHRGIMRKHPGAFYLNETHAKEVDAALKRYREDHPKAVAAFDYVDENGVLARLEWLAFWVRWALDNCEVPAIWNT